MKNAVFSLFAIAATANAAKVLSTVYETEVQTITSCAPTVTDCPAAHKTIVHTYTSECDEETKPYPTHVYTSEEHKKAYTLSTVYETKVYTITSCAPTVTDCPVGHVTTTVQESTTLCPVTEYPSKPTYPAYPPHGGNGTYYPPTPPKDTYPPGNNGPYPSKPVVVVPPPVLKTITVETCVPTVITKVITVTGEGPHPTPVCPGGYNCPAEGDNHGKPTPPAEVCPGGYNCPAEGDNHGKPTPPAEVCPGGYNCPPVGTAAPTGAYYTKPMEYAGSASTQRAGGLLLAVALAAVALL